MSRTMRMVDEVGKLLVLVVGIGSSIGLILAVGLASYNLY